MHHNPPFRQIVDEAQYLLARRRHRTQERPRLVVVHGHHRPGTICLPGETIDRCYLQYPDREVPIPLSLPGLMVCDCMVRHCTTPLSVARMELILTGDPFYRRLGTNAFERAEKTPIFTRGSLRVYIARLQAQIAKSLKKGGSICALENAFLSAPTDSNVVVHRITLSVEILHQSNRLIGNALTSSSRFL